MNLSQLTFAFLLLLNSPLSQFHFCEGFYVPNAVNSFIPTSTLFNYDPIQHSEIHLTNPSTLVLNSFVPEPSSSSNLTRHHDDYVNSHTPSNSYTTTEESLQSEEEEDEEESKYPGKSVKTKEEDSNETNEEDVEESDEDGEDKYGCRDEDENSVKDSSSDEEELKSEEEEPYEMEETPLHKKPHSKNEEEDQSPESNIILHVHDHRHDHEQDGGKPGMKSSHGDRNRLPPHPAPAKGSVDYVLIPMILIGLFVPIFTVLFVVLGSYDAVFCSKLPGGTCQNLRSFNFDHPDSIPAVLDNLVDIVSGIVDNPDKLTDQIKPDVNRFLEE